MAGIRDLCRRNPDASYTIAMAVAVLIGIAIDLFGA